MEIEYKITESEDEQGENEFEEIDEWGLEKSDW